MGAYYKRDLNYTLPAPSVCILVCKLTLPAPSVCILVCKLTPRQRSEEVHRVKLNGAMSQIMYLSVNGVFTGSVHNCQKIAD